MLRHAFSFTGRTSRAGFWASQVIGLLLWVPYAWSFQNEHPFGPIVTCLFLAASLAGIWLGLAATVRRWHDRNRSAWFVFVGLVPVAGPLWTLVECGFVAGTNGKNNYDGLG